MKAQPYKIDENNDLVPCAPEEAMELKILLPVWPDCLLLPVQIKGRREGTGNWTWNGCVDKPTLKPSILTHCPWKNDSEKRMHCWVNDGKITFLSDCHDESIRGKTMDLEDIDD